ncbi:MAG TPA: RNA polymerase sigma factor [Polyangiaceae bacterium]|jgi:RNA polymerase sigma-70 factor (ECF subfamily)
MTADEREERSRRLLLLLGPLHDPARAAARRLCRSNADGDDLFQDSVLRAYDRLHELKDEGRFRSWFFAILLSAHRARHRRDFWRRLFALDDLKAEPGRPPEAEELDGAQRMALALGTLSAESREAVVLFEIEGFFLEEIAELQGASLSAIKSRLSRARASLARHYAKDVLLPPLATEKTP